MSAGLMGWRLAEQKAAWMVDQRVVMMADLMADLMAALMVG